MSGHMPEPGIQDVLSAIRGFADTYHDLHLAFERETRELRHAIHAHTQRLDSFFGQLDMFVRKMDRQIDLVWNKLDRLDEQYGESKADRADLRARLEDMRARLERIEQSLEGGDVKPER